MGEALKISQHYSRFPFCGIFVILFLSAISARQQEIAHPNSFSTLLNILDDHDEGRERRDVSEDYLASDEPGSGDVNDGKGPGIILSEQKKFVLRVPGKLLVDVGCTVYAVKGAQITVSCRANSTNGATKIEWFKDGFPVKERFEANVAARLGSLTIRVLNRFNEGTYTCKASSSEGVTEALFTAKIADLNLPTILKAGGSLTFGPNDKSVTITIGADVTVYRGATLVIRCPVESADDTRVFWTNINGRPVTVGKAAQVGNDIVISDIDERYAIPFICTARTRRGQDNARSTVLVKGLTPPKINPGNKDIRITDEETSEVEIFVGTKLTVISETLVKVRCDTSTEPAPAVSWEVQGKNSDFRDTVSLSKDNSTLTLSDPGGEDSGVYKCTASNNVGQDSKSSTIDVLPTEPPRIVHSDKKLTLLKRDELLEAKIGDQVTVLAGGNVVITCRTYGIPTPAVKWKKDGEDMSVSGDRLEIRNATTTDSGDFTCEAVNRAGRFSYTSKFQVIAVEKPEIQSSSGRVIGVQGMEEAVATIGQDLRVVEGLIVRLFCPVSKGFPTPSVTWFLNDRLVRSSARFSIDTRSNSFTVNGINKQDTGQVSCVASNGAGRATESSFVSIIGESTAQITPGNSSFEFITEKTKVSIQIGDSLKVLTGSDVSIDCLAHGTPPPIINWRRNGQDVRSGGRRGQFIITELSEGSRLAIKQITSQSTGQFECVATNKGRADRTASRIIVFDATFPKIDGASNSVEHTLNLQPISIQIGTRVTLLQGARLEITCPASSIPDPSISWLKQGKQITPSERFVIQNDALIIPSTELSDGGIITCAANNSMGRVTVSSSVTIIEPVKPTITKTGKNLKVETIRRLAEPVGGNILSRDGIYLELTCSAQGTPPPTIVWLRGSTTRVGSGNKLNLGVLKEESSGDYTCVASNLGGEDRKTTKLNVTSGIAPIIQSSSEVIESFGDDTSLVATIGTRLKIIQGKQIELICHVSGFPSPKVDWTKGNELIDQQSERQGLFIFPYNGTSSSLRISGSQQSPQDVVFGCTAYNSGGSATAFSYVTFYERVEPVILSTWRTGSVGVKESLLSRDPVKVTVGDDVLLLTKTKLTIKCPVTAIPLATVTWTYNGGFMSSKHKQSGTDLVLSNESGSSDSGRYRCTARNRLGRDSSYSVVTFLEPTMPSIIIGGSSVRQLTTDEFTASIGSNITTIVDSNITFRCVADGRPRPSVSWLKDGEPLNVTSTPFTMYAFDTNATGTYSCVARNLAGSVVANSAVKIFDRSILSATLPRIITSRRNQLPTDSRRLIEQTIGGNVTIIEGKDLLLRCPVEGSPLPSTSWLFNGRPVVISDTVQVDEVMGNLKIIEMTPEDKGMYTCVATNIAGETREISYSTIVEPTFPVIDSTNVTIEVFDKTRKVIRVKIGSKVTTLTGTPVAITCNATGFPVPKIAWMRGFTAITGSDAQSLIMSPGKINLLRASKRDSGVYFCTASSPGGHVSAASNVTFVEPVKPKILFSTKEQEILHHVSVNITIGEKLTVLDKSNVSIECMGKGMPSPSLSWSKDGLKLESAQSNVLHLSRVSLEDAGLYACTMENFLGSDSQSVVLSVKEPSKPVIDTSVEAKILEARDRNPITLTIGDNVTALTKTGITIQCPTSGVPTPTVTWTKDGQEIPSGGSYKVQGDGSLVIIEADEDDNGQYTCTADSDAGKDSVSSIVQVKEPVKPKIEVSESVQEIPVGDGSPVTMNIGDNVTAASNTTITIRCPVSGVPAPVVFWLKDGAVVSPRGEYSVTDDNSLVIKGGDVDDTAMYTCSAQTIFGTYNMSSMVVLKEHSVPSILTSNESKALDAIDRSPIMLNVGDTVTALTNTSITIQCPTSGVPTPTVTWTKDGQEIPSEGSYKAQDDGSLVISEAKVEDSAQYTCNANSVTGKDSKSSTVRVAEPVEPKIEIIEAGQEIPVGDGRPVTMNVGDNVTAASNTTITIRCPVSGVPAPSVTWAKDGVKVGSSDYFTITKEKSLVINGTNVKHSAKYTCTVKSKFGMESISSFVSIKEHSKPKFGIKNESKTVEAQDRSPITLTVGDNVTALSNTSITIQCPTSGVPTPSVAWTKDGQEIPSGGKYKVQDDSSLVIVKADEYDSGQYTCIADSVAGKDSKSSTVQVVEPVKAMIENMEVPREIPVGDGSPVIMNIGDNVTAVSNTTITIRCPVRGVPTPSVTWTKNAVPINAKEKLFVDGSTLVIVGANLQDRGKYTCKVENHFGKVDMSSLINIAAPLEPAIVTSAEPKAIVAGNRDPVTATIGDNVTALTNTSITIQCPTSGIPTPTVTWTKDGQEIPSGGRYKVQEDGSLVISGSGMEDNAKYMCSAESISGKDSLSSILRVVEPVKPVVDVPQHGKEIPVGDGSPVTMNIGDNVTAASNTTIIIRCPVSGVPTPSVTWTKDGKTVVESKKLYIGSNNMLLIRGAKNEDSAKYSCITENDFGRETMSSTVVVKGHSKPTVKIPDNPTALEAKDRSPISIRIGNNVTALTNTSITIQCPTSGVPTPTVTWTKDGQQIPSGGKYKVQVDGSLVISEADEDDNGQYTCTADSVAGKDSVSSTVQVKDPEKPEIDIPDAERKDIPIGDGSPVAINIGDNVTAASNTTITLKCPVSGVPTPTVTWNKDGAEVTKGGRYFFSENNSLVIKGAKAEDSGNYFCVIQSAFGKEQLSSQVTIKEPVAPQILSLHGDLTSYDQKSVNVTIGQNLSTLIDTKLTINCTVKGIPIPKVTWTRGNETLPSDGRMIVKNGTLTIVELETSDSGNYTCFSENPVGKTSVSSTVTVAALLPPEIIRAATRDVQVVEPKSFEVSVGNTVLTISGNNLTLSCQVKGFPPPSVQWTKDGSPLESDGSDLQLQQLYIKDSGVYTCTASSLLQGLSDATSTNLTVVATQVPIISIENQTLEMLKIEDLSVAVGGAITTLDGNSVTLVCEVSGVPVPQITWVKDGAEVQRGGKSYTIESAVRSDSGSYTCVATNIAGGVKATSQLSVLVGSAPKIDSAQENTVHMRIDIFSMTIGSNLTTLASSGVEISCPATGFPKPVIQWYREGVPVQSSMMLTIDEDTGTLFTLSISHRKGGTFTCEARNVLGSKSVSSHVIVLAPEAPKINVSRSAVTSLDSRKPVIVRVGQKLDVLSGTNVSIECPVSGIPEPVVNWKRQDGPLHAEDSVLTLDSVTIESTGVYVCKAFNLAGDVMASSMVNVTESSPPKISAVSSSLMLLDSGSFTVDVGSNVTAVTGIALSIRCNATGTPAPVITWRKDGTLLKAKGALLVLLSLSGTDSGQYQCTASNVDGADVQDLRIEVLAGSRPEITTKEENIMAVYGEKEVSIGVGGNLTTVVGTDVKILCPVTALPNATITWLFNGSSVKEENRRLIKNGGISLTGVIPEHVGSYTCVARNPYGSASKTTMLSLIIPVEPKILSSNRNIEDFTSASHDLVIGDKLEALDGSTVYIRCPATGNPPPVIEWKKSGAAVTMSSNLQIVNNTLVLLDSELSDNESYTCVASNGAGSDERETILSFKAPEKPSIRGESMDVESFDMQPITVVVGSTLKVLEKTTVKIRCIASGIPEPSVYWNSSSNMQPANKFDVNQGGQLLTIRKVDASDTGEYLCNAVNKAGEVTEAAFVEVVEATIPRIETSDAMVSWYNRESHEVSVGGTVEVLSGTKVTLTCQYSGFPEPAIKWNVLDEEGQAMKQDEGYEVINGSLVLTALQPSDSAEYVCSVRNVAGTASASTKLKVFDPQPPSMISSQDTVVSLSEIVPVQASVGSVLTVLSGSSIVITCSADGFPTPSVAWTKGEQLIHKSNELTIVNATESDSGDYLCTAMSEIGSDQESTKITVMELSKPVIQQPSVDKISLANKTSVDFPVGSDITVLTQTRVNITCQVDGLPKPEITWLKDGNPVAAETGNSLEMTISGVEDAGQVTCIAQNIMGNATLSSGIDVVEPVLPRINAGEGEILALNKRQPVAALIGVTVQTFTRTTLTLDCIAEGSPQPVVSWTKNGDPLESEGGRVSVKDDGTVIIKNTRVSDSGTYICEAESVVGETSVASAVYVRAPIRPRIKKSRSYIIWYERQPFKGKIGDNLTTLKGRTLTLTCPALGLPQPAIAWYRGGMRMRGGGNYVVIGNKLILYNLDPMDTDRYTCVARNFAGVRSATSTLKVHEPMAPKIMPLFSHQEALQNQNPLNVTIGGEASLLQGSRLTIKCPFTGVPEPKIKWIKDRKMLTSNERMEMDCAGVLNIFKVKLEDSGDYACIAESFLGMDMAFSSITVFEAVKPSVEISGRVYVSGGSIVDMHVGDNLTAIVTTPVLINCSARGTPRPNMRWQMNGKQLGNGGNYKTDNSGTLEIKRLENPGEFRCIAENFLGKDGASSFINLLDPVKPSIISSEVPQSLEAKDVSPIIFTIGDNMTALTNTSLTIQCPTNGVPSPTVTWTKDGLEIPGRGRYKVQDDGSLVIGKADGNDNAQYTCTSSNVVGNSSASSIVQIVDPIAPTIDVTEAGQNIPLGDGRPVTMNIGDNVTAAFNTTITIRCPVSGIPTPTVTWNKDGVKISVAMQYSVTRDNSLVIRGSASDDSAEYTCTVESVSGSDSASSVVKIIGPSRPVVKGPDNPKSIEAQDRSPMTLTIGDNVTALTNMSITIQCPTSGLPTPTVTWTKDGQEIPSGGRYKVQDDGSLVISEADEDDKGQYTCTADSVAGKDSKSTTVRIVEPTKPKIYVSESGKEIPVGDGSPVKMNIGDNVTASSNTTITIRCPVSGVPTPSVFWTKDGFPISNKSGNLFTSGNTLVIERANAGDSGEYTCISLSSTGVDSVSSRVQIIDPSKPSIDPSGQPKIIEAKDRTPISMTIGDNVTAFTNTSITIQCPTSGVPLPTVTWTKDGQEISSVGRYKVKDDGSLVIGETGEDDNGQYTCTADSVAGKDNKSSMVQVIEPTKPTINVPRPGQKIPIGDGSPVIMNIGDNVTAASNTTVTIRCPVSGVPIPSVTWTKDGKQLNSGDNAAITSDNSLVITQADAEDSAEYTCNVQGLTGSDTASSVVQILEHSEPSVGTTNESKTVEAHHRSPITIIIGDNVTALTNTSITIQCPTSGVPTPTVTWTKDGQEIPSGGKYKVRDDGSLVISEADEDHNGQYTCTADSVAGKDSKSSMVKINDLEEPRILVLQPPPVVSIGDGQPLITPVGSRITELTGTKLTLTCPTEGLPPPRITWKKDGVILSERYVIDKTGSLIIQTAEVNDTGKFTCSARNEVGVDEVSSLIDILEPSQPSISPPKGAITSDDYRSVTAGVGSKIDAFEGATVKITCTVTGVPKPDVQWSMDGETISPGGHLTLDVNRSLVIDGAFLQDSGDYTCTANSRGGQTSATSSLDIRAPLPPVIVSRSDAIVWYKADPLSATIGSLIRTLVGTRITLTCPATGNPTPKMSWKKGGETLSQTGLDLTIDAVGSDVAGIYTCVATNIAGSAEASSDIAVEAPTPPSVRRSLKEVIWNNDSPLTVNIGSRVSILNGSLLILKCMASGLPPPELTWTRGIKDLTGDGRYDIGEQTLTINNVQFADADEYTCRASNRAGQDAATTELVVRGPGGPVILVDKRVIVDVNSSKPVMAPVGATITTVVNASVVMKCPNKGIPKPRVSWSYNQRFILPGGRFVTNGSSLVVRGIRLSDAGSYQCTASNIYGRDVESLTLTVAVPPLISNVKGTFEITDIRDIVSITTGAVVTIPRGVTVRVKCLATGIPKPSIAWYKQLPGRKKRYPVVQGQDVQVLYDFSLSITNAAVNDAAYYICVASNIAGKDEGSTRLSIGAPPAVPSHWQGIKSRFNIPKHARRTSAGAIATVVRGASLLLKCEANGNPKPKITWVVFTASIEERHSVLDDGTLVIPSVDFEDEGNFTCIANNSYGTLRRTTTVSILAPPEILDRHFRHIGFDEKEIEGYAMAHADIKRKTISSLSVERGYNLMLMCTVVGKPTPIVAWRRNGLLIKNDSRHVILPSGVLLVRQVDTELSGQYKCVASNIVGRDHGSVRLIVKNEATGNWRTTAWSKCGNCVTHLRGWQERHVSCIAPGGKAISDLHYIHKHKPSQRRRCTHRDCHVVWRTIAWSACSRSCGSHGVKLRSIECVFAKSLKLAKGQCQWRKKPPLQEPCHRKPCKQANCVDKVRYCQRIKQLGMCTMYSRWCCATCRN